MFSWFKRNLPIGLHHLLGPPFGRVGGTSLVQVGGTTLIELGK